MAAEVPQTILIVGAGVFGLSTAQALLKRPLYDKARITLVAPHDQELIASNDTTRIIRADYSDPVYYRLGEEAQAVWRGDFGADGRYSECGLLLTAEADGRPEALEYVREALVNVRSLPGAAEASVELPDAEAIIAASRCDPSTASATGDRGYINRRSGYADAGAALKHVKELLSCQPRLELVDGEATRLLVDDDHSRVLGVGLTDARELRADLTILATGAWTPKLVDLRGRACARGQCMMYVGISGEEAEALKNLPVSLNMTDGCFYFPPNRTPGGGWEIKVAQHAYGYANPTQIHHALGVADGEDVKVSLPWFPSQIPDVNDAKLRSFFARCFPKIGESLAQRDVRTRMCWYLDTLTGDWLICPHPDFTVSTPTASHSYGGPSLFLATAGSGHGFKFLPVIGEKVVDVLSGEDKAAGGLLTNKWAWPKQVEEDEFWCNDGSRGGDKGHVLQRKS